MQLIAYTVKGELTENEIIRALEEPFHDPAKNNYEESNYRFRSLTFEDFSIVMEMVDEIVAKKDKGKDHVVLHEISKEHEVLIEEIQVNAMDSVTEELLDNRRFDLSQNISFDFERRKTISGDVKFVLNDTSLLNRNISRRQRSFSDVNNDIGDSERINSATYLNSLFMEGQRNVYDDITIALENNFEHESIVGNFELNYFIIYMKCIRNAH